MENPDQWLDANQTGITVQSDVQSVRILALPASKSLHALPRVCKDNRGGRRNWPSETSANQPRISASFLNANAHRTLRRLTGCHAWVLAGVAKRLPKLAPYESLTAFWPALWGLVQ
jgi:hypothetical protein